MSIPSWAQCSIRAHLPQPLGPPAGHLQQFSGRNTTAVVLARKVGRRSHHEFEKALHGIIMGSNSSKWLHRTI